MKRSILWLMLTTQLVLPAQAESVAAVPGHQNTEAIRVRTDRIRSAISEQEPWMGLVGDSGISGAATSEHLHATAFSLLTVIGAFLLESQRTVQVADINRIPDASRFNLQGELQPLVRVVYSQDEFEAAKKENKHVELNLAAKGSLRLDVPEYSYGYLTGRALGFPAERIVLVAQDGQRVDSIYKQMRRFNEVSETMPSMVLLSYSANDLCGDELDGQIATFQKNFENELRQQFDQVLGRLKPHATLGTRVIVMAPLDVPQILTNRNLLQQQVYFQGRGQVRCEDIRYHRAANSSMGQKVQDALVSMCRSVLNTHPNDAPRIQKLRDFQAAQIEVWQRVLSSLPVRNGWSFELNLNSRRAVFESGDLANDCFHPGPGAHARIAGEILKSLRP